jgi:hypothetical protein
VGPPAARGEGIRDGAAQRRDAAPALRRPASRLSVAERQDLRGLESTLGSRGAGTGGGTVEGIAITE